MNLLGFLLVLVPLVVIHELGHFIMAKLGGISVTRFAIGFGKTLFSFHYKGTEYCWNLLPFGGYVDFMGELVYTNEIPDDVAHFYNRPKWLRFLVLVMGPLFNLILAFVIFWALFWVQPFKAPVYQTEPYTVGYLAPEGPSARAGLQIGDRVLFIDGDEVTDVNKVHEFFLTSPNHEVELTVLRGDSQIKLSYTVGANLIEGHGLIDFYPDQRAMVDVLSPGLPAELAGIQPQTVVTHINDNPVTVYDVARSILQNGTQSFSLETNQGTVLVTPSWGNQGWNFAFQLNPQFVDGVWRPNNHSFQYTKLVELAENGQGQPFHSTYEEQTFRFTPQQTEDGWVFSVSLSYDPGPEGVQTLGLYNLNLSYDQLIDSIKDAGPRELSFTLDGVAEPLKVTPQWDSGRWLVGIRFSPEYEEQDLDWKGAFVQGWDSILSNSTLIYKSVRKLIIGELPLKTLSGPVGVARVAAEALDAGFLPFITLMAILSLNLGLLNLLPIPVLDGGEIFVLLVEWIARKDFSLAVKMRIKMVGFFFIIGLMAIVLVTDVIKIISTLQG